MGNKADSNALIADVDCTVDDGKKLCEKFGVQGYPTIKYFSKDTGDEGEKYEGPREYNKLKELSDLFEKQKEVSIATMKEAEEAQKTKDALSKKLKWKLNLLSQKVEKKEEL